MANCTCCSLLTWDYLKPSYYTPPRQDPRKAGGILLYNGQVLIVQSRGNKWGFPKGGFEPGENATQCAQREVQEETSLDVRFNEEDPQVRYKKTIFYVKYLHDKPSDISLVKIRTPGNDCTGIGWIRLSCLKKIVDPARRRRKPKNKQDDLVEGLEQLTLQPMKFNLGLRNFVNKYMNTRR